MKTGSWRFLGAAAFLGGFVLVSWGWMQEEPSPVPGSQTNPGRQPDGAAPATAGESVAQSAGTSGPRSVSRGSAKSRKTGFAAIPVLEANALLNEIGKKDFPSILQAMLDAERVEHDQTKQLAIQTTLTGAIRDRTPPPGFFEQLRQFAVNPSNPESERELVLAAVGSAATEETTKFLIDLTLHAQDPALRRSAGSFLGLAGAMNGAGVKLAPMLDELWLSSRDQNLLLTIAQPMAKIGAPSSVGHLLSAALAPFGKDNLRKGPALGGVEEIFQPRAVPPVAALLERSTPGSPENKLAGLVLVNIGDAAAGRALVAWLEKADARAAPIAREWVNRTQGPELLAEWNAALDAKIGFRSERVREAIRAGLNEYRQDHGLGR